MIDTIKFVDDFFICNDEWYKWKPKYEMELFLEQNNLNKDKEIVVVGINQKRITDIWRLDFNKSSFKTIGSSGYPSDKFKEISEKELSVILIAYGNKKY